MPSVQTCWNQLNLAAHDTYHLCTSQSGIRRIAKTSIKGLKSAQELLDGWEDIAFAIHATVALKIFITILNGKSLADNYLDFKAKFIEKGPLLKLSYIAAAGAHACFVIKCLGVVGIPYFSTIAAAKGTVTLFGLGANLSIGIIKNSCSTGKRVFKTVHSIRSGPKEEENRLLFYGSIALDIAKISIFFITGGLGLVPSLALVSPISTPVIICLLALEILGICYEVRKIQIKRKKQLEHDTDQMLAWQEVGYAHLRFLQDNRLTISPSNTNSQAIKEKTQEFIESLESMKGTVEQMLDKGKPLGKKEKQKICDEMQDLIAGSIDYILKNPISTETSKADESLGSQNIEVVRNKGG